MVCSDYLIKHVSLRSHFHFDPTWIYLNCFGLIIIFSFFGFQSCRTFFHVKVQPLQHFRVICKCTHFWSRTESYKILPMLEKECSGCLTSALSLTWLYNWLVPALHAHQDPKISPPMAQLIHRSLDSLTSWPLVTLQRITTWPSLQRLKVDEDIPQQRHVLYSYQLLWCHAVDKRIYAPLQKIIMF